MLGPQDAQPRDFINESLSVLENGCLHQRIQQPLHKSLSLPPACMLKLHYSNALDLQTLSVLCRGNSVITIHVSDACTHTHTGAAMSLAPLPHCSSCKLNACMYSRTLVKPVKTGVHGMHACGVWRVRSKVGLARNDLSVLSFIIMHALLKGACAVVLRIRAAPTIQGIGVVSCKGPLQGPPTCTRCTMHANQHAWRPNDANLNTRLNASVFLSDCTSHDRPWIQRLGTCTRTNGRTSAKRHGARLAKPASACPQLRARARARALPRPRARTCC